MMAERENERTVKTTGLFLHSERLSHPATFKRTGRRWMATAKEREKAKSERRDSSPPYPLVQGSETIWRYSSEVTLSRGRRVEAGVEVERKNALLKQNVNSI